MREEYPYLRKMNKRTDFCEKCCELRQNIDDHKNDETLLIQLKLELSNYLDQAARARMFTTNTN